MRKLFDQIVKFGIVGVICFLIDFGVYTFLCNGLGVPYLIAGFCGFTISVTVNYVLSMRFVFTRREDMSRRREFVIFVALSLVGLALNEVLLYLCIDVVYRNWLVRIVWLGWLSEGLMNIGAKLFATGVVMVYNFISRKLTLEQRDA